MVLDWQWWLFCRPGCLWRLATAAGGADEGLTFSWGNPMKTTSHARSAFGLLELCVVLGILTILIGLMLPAVQKARDTSLRLKCLNNLRQIGVALVAHHDSHSSYPSN